MSENESDYEISNESPEKNQSESQYVFNPFEDKSYIFLINPEKYLFHSFINDEGSLGPIATFFEIVKDKKITDENAYTEGKDFCIKKIERPYETCSRGKRVLKLMSILSELEHPNIVKLERIDIPDDDNYDSAYLFFENYPCNLERLICSDYDYKNNPKIIPWIIYQILKGLYYLHSKGIIHRNIKPANILIDQNCHVKICGFGKSIYESDYENTLRGEINDFISEKIALNYQAPEALASKKKSKEDYDKKIDIWGVGVISLELLNKKSPFFLPVKNCKLRWEAMLNGIFMKLGKPDKEILIQFASRERLKNIMKFKNYPKMDEKQLFPDIEDKNAIDLIKKFLTINPNDRISILKAKDHPFFDIIKDWKEKDDFIDSGKTCKFRYKDEIEKMENVNEYYNNQLDYYKKNIQNLKGTYTKLNIIYNTPNNQYNYYERTRDTTYD